MCQLLKWIISIARARSSIAELLFTAVTEDVRWMFSLSHCKFPSDFNAYKASIAEKIC